MSHLLADPRSIWTTLLAMILTISTATAAPPRYPCEDDLLEVLFAFDARVRIRDGDLVDLAAGGRSAGALAGLATVLGPATHTWQPLCDVPEARLDALSRAGVYNLNNAYHLRLTGRQDVWDLATRLEALPGVITAQPVPRPQALPVPPPFAQLYLNSAASTPTGLDFAHAWTLPGGNGSGVTVCDLEYSWRTTHIDLTQAPGSQINTNISDPFNDDNHGTGVIGELCADANGWGVTGACYGATLKTCGTFYGTLPVWNVAGAIILATSALSPGDVILLEQQWAYAGASGFVPIEWWGRTTPAVQSFNSVYAAITNAVAAGITVVECGGNGGLNTETMTWYGDSGAIIVGAGGVYTGGTYSEGDLQRLSFSSYGPRFNLQGWGENVVTTGGGDLYSAEGQNAWYTQIFSGTSSAAPMVAAAIASCVGYSLANVSPIPPTPAALRSLLASTGTPQVLPPAGNIGPRPNLQAALTALAPPAWVDVTPPALQASLSSKGVAWGDYDVDGDPDLYVTVVWGPNQIFRNDGGAFVALPPSPLYDIAQGAGAAWGDYDADGDLDLYLANYGTPNVLFRNLGADVFAAATTPPLDDPGAGTSVAWLDFDADGALDVALGNNNLQANKLFKGDGAGVFQDITPPPMAMPTNTLCLSCADYDRDGDQDIFVANYNGQSNQLLRNDGSGMFTDVTMPPLNNPGNNTSGAWGDYDNDGDLDLYVSVYGAPNLLLRCDGPGAFANVANGHLANSGLTMGAAWADYDLDGDLDLYFVNNPGPNKLLCNRGGNLFTDETVPPLDDAGNGQGVAWADFDRDGDPDLCFANYNSHDHVVRNDQSTGNHWLRVRLHASNGNVNAVGARVTVVAGPLRLLREIGTGAGFCGQSELVASFGLGSFTSVDTLRVSWRGQGWVDTCSLAVDRQIDIWETNLTAVTHDAPPTGAAALRMLPASPNPFNPRTVIRYVLPTPADVTLRIFDARGRLVRTLCEREPAAQGTWDVIWDGTTAGGRPAGSGTYLCRLEAAGHAAVQRLMLVR